MFEGENAKLMSNRMIAGTASEQALCDRIIGRILNESVITNLKMVDVNRFSAPQLVDDEYESVFDRFRVKQMSEVLT